MIVAPNSPRPRANESASPAIRPPRASGRTTRKNVRAGPAPSVRDAAVRCGSVASNDAIRELVEQPARRGVAEDPDDREQQEEQRGDGDRDEDEAQKPSPHRRLPFTVSAPLAVYFVFFDAGLTRGRKP